MSLASAALVSLLALLAPLIVRLIRLPGPDIVVQILLGIVVGPQVLGWARIDEPVSVLSLIGLSFLLFLGGLELDLRRLRGRTLRTAASAFVLSCAIALALGTLLALQDTTAQIQVRAAVALLMGFAALATGFGLDGA
jgi:Kef-type K+ transport system membrane component KefB